MINKIKTNSFLDKFFSGNLISNNKTYSSINKLCHISEKIYEKSMKFHGFFFDEFYIDL